jgi:predicted nucleotidyltransferase
MTEALKKALDAIIKVADPDKVILFGSQARGEGSPDSDYDLLVLKKGVKHKRKLAQKIHMKSDFDVPIDLIVNDTERFEQIKKDQYMIYKAIDEEGKVIYEKK